MSTARRCNALRDCWLAETAARQTWSVVRRRGGRRRSRRAHQVLAKRHASQRLSACGRQRRAGKRKVRGWGRVLAEGCCTTAMVGAADAQAACSVGGHATASIRSSSRQRRCSHPRVAQGAPGEGERKAAQQGVQLCAATASRLAAGRAFLQQACGPSPSSLFATANGDARGELRYMAGRNALLQPRGWRFVEGAACRLQAAALHFCICARRDLTTGFRGA